MRSNAADIAGRENRCELEQNIPSEAIYWLCFAACFACAALFLRSWLRVRLSLMLWGASGFILLAISNGLLLLDKISLPALDLSGYRLLASVAGVGLLLFGTSREGR